MKYWFRKWRLFAFPHLSLSLHIYTIYHFHVCTAILQQFYSIVLLKKIENRSFSKSTLWIVAPHTQYKIVDKSHSDRRWWWWYCGSFFMMWILYLIVHELSALAYILDLFPCINQIGWSSASRWNIMKFSVFQTKSCF